ncbi:MAG: hypothetical protein EOP49_10195 [Sphingobacteriales bacterium]|nr:MAG: hypothetical protein EOP49_10195 [Sphingobacteriales bacterium]
MSRQYRLLFLASSILLLSTPVSAQFELPADLQKDTVKRPVEQIQFPATASRPVIKPKKPKPITREFAGGIRLNTDGWSLFAERGVSRYEDTKTSEKFYNVRLFSAEITEHKHPKEAREASDNRGSGDQEKARPYILGKINNFYALKLGYGNRRMIAGKPEPGTVSIHWVYTGGLSLGMLKPYYVDAYTGPLSKEAIKYEESTKEIFVSERHIVGSAGWSKGLNELQFVPGIHAKTGLHFDFASNGKSKLALETGVSAEMYTKKIELMVRQKAYPYLISGYVSFLFGKRW